MADKISKVVMLLLFLAGCSTTSIKPVENKLLLQSDLQKSSYAQGVQYMKNLQQSEIPLDQALFVQGLNDVLNKKLLRLNPAELQKGQDWVFVQQVLHNEKVAAENLKIGKAFLDANKQKPGVQTTASGLQYKILMSGKSARKPNLSDTLQLRYRITRLDGQELTSTEKDSKIPEVQVDGLIKGWQEAMLLMTEGAKWQLFVPSDLAYGEVGAPDGRLGPNETLIYDVELVAITGQINP
ncbi:MAG: FKBP-type peptidyl-prolyl cis-trans isomerase N-terminal domain-containing protein [Methylococcaceae bacterium]|nr:FKBP-type peptidyl-prolyl cis-trans isomerase N-terminal domain-containing protein [Methylococcaceae bacterium]MDZ4156598.1 FKBP-type peptidyl-prolyl cis-trans isomerase N-terminal domain-containing protein [Methylococcales bacterium]MDP2394748.1 FKBP-type peptidyl-prolyl cis-trans isomerase N-terminal domain-containing protein [Methylococcaceae bacterium]MDP3020170.1 FKBP-type peptidyl-prolyl cis-trans isomerase N-terminal domain-containing protein [Methylococcaceae bacterium]MDP3390710.1 F